MKKVLVVASDFPYPALHGGKIDIWNGIRCLKKIGYDIDLAVTVKDPHACKQYEHFVKEYVDDIYYVKRKNNLKDIISLNPLQVESRKKLEQIKFYKNYNLIYLISDYVGCILENKTLKYEKVVLRSQNIESTYFHNLALSSNNILKKVYYFLDCLKFKRYEPNLMKKINNIMFISYDEKKEYDKLFPELNTVFLPANVELEFKRQSLKSKTVVNIGSLFMENNKEGLKWYLSEVHPLVSQKIKDYRLFIAGNSNGESLKWLYELTNKYDNIDISDSPEDLTDIYATGALFINPMRHGAGVKLKTVEAILNGLPVISTTVGNEGTGLKNGQDIIVTDNCFEYAKHIIELLCENSNKKINMVISAQNFIKENYDAAKILDNFLKII